MVLDKTGRGCLYPSFLPSFVLIQTYNPAITSFNWVEHASWFLRKLDRNLTRTEPFQLLKMYSFKEPKGSKQSLLLFTLLNH
jgi:hypothetical protein